MSFRDAWTNPAVRGAARSPAALDRPTVVGRAAWQLYANASGPARLLMSLRPRICPVHRLIEETPYGSSVLDIGCGSGLFLNMLAASGRLSTGVGFDPSERALRAARAGRTDGCAIEFIAGDVRSADWPPGTWDVVSLIDVLHHLPENRQANAVRKAATRVAPGGRLIVKDMSRRAHLRRWMNRLHDVVMARQWIREPDMGLVAGVASRCGLHEVLSERIDMLWYAHELRIFERPHAG